MVQAPSFGELLRRARVAAGLTQEALAERAGLSATAISALERGVRQTPQGETLRLLTDALALPDEERARLAAAARRLDARSGAVAATGSPASPVPGGLLPRGGDADTSPSEAEAPDVYLVHARADGALVARLGADLLAWGIRPWRATQELQPGTPGWELDARDAIRAARAVLYLGSPEARSSRYVADELRVAELYRRPIYPLWLAGEAWLECVPLGWGGMQYLDARGDGYAAALDEIVTLLRGGLPAEASRGAPPEGAAPGEPRNPYKGLRAFRAADAGDFFGRETAVAGLLAVLAGEKEQAPRCLAVVGPSGSGKSSAVMAGLLPRLRRGAVSGSEFWIYLDPVQPGVHPLEALTVTLATAMPECSLMSIRADLDHSTRGLHLLARPLDRRREWCSSSINSRKHSPSPPAKRSGAASSIYWRRQLRRLAGPRRSSSRCGPTSRSASGYPALGRLMEGHSISVLPMSTADLRPPLRSLQHCPTWDSSTRIWWGICCTSCVDSPEHPRSWSSPSTSSCAAEGRYLTRRRPTAPWAACRVRLPSTPKRSTSACRRTSMGNSHVPCFCD